MTAQPFSAAGIRWDLGDLFASHDDPRIESTLGDCRERAGAFAERYRGTIAVAGGPGPEHLLAAIRQLEALDETCDGSPRSPTCCMRGTRRSRRSGT